MLSAGPVLVIRSRARRRMNIDKAPKRESRRRLTKYSTPAATKTSDIREPEPTTSAQNEAPAENENKEGSDENFDRKV